MKSVSQKEAAKTSPERSTNIVRNLCVLGKIKQFGLKSKKIVWRKTPEKIAVRERMVVDQLM